jgi:hypothetical protein
MFLKKIRKITTITITIIEACSFDKSFCFVIVIRKIKL